MLARLSVIVLVCLTFRGLAAEPSQPWVTSRSLNAPEAHQASAADEQFFYAITNSSVGKYDRKTGKRLAISTGSAKHLNSGFFWKGKLLCAHSNYPQKPEQTEVKALDPISMKLSTFKSFGKAGGSLTWIVRHSEHWWCNFARYGSDNASTFLVKYDDQWNEVARWTYPKGVIRQLGKHSLSGGLWYQNELWVSGHDDPILFRLVPPAKGNELRYRGNVSVPFAGQGIAVDPVTEGLMGIHRKRKQILLAKLSNPKSLTIRVLSYNIHHAAGVDGKLDLKRIAKVIMATKADIVALQEVDQKVKRTNGVDQPAELARLTGMKVTFGANINLQAGEYGNAILSRWDIRNQKNHLLPCLEQGEQRGVLMAEIHPPGHKAFVLMATHLDHRRKGAERLSSARKINDLIQKQKAQHAILAGDMNATPESKPLIELGKLWHRANEKPIPTVPVKLPKRQIDYILVRPKTGWKVIETKAIDEQIASDHRPILAVLQWRN